MDTVRARFAWLLIGVIALAGCKSTGNGWAFWKSNPTNDSAGLARSDYPVPPSKSSTPTVTGPASGRTAANAPGSTGYAPGGSTLGGTGTSAGLSGTRPASFNSTAGPSGTGFPSTSQGSRTGSLPGNAVASDPLSPGPQRGSYNPASGPTSTTRAGLAGSIPAGSGSTYPSTPSYPGTPPGSYAGTPSGTYPGTGGSTLFGGVPPGGYRSASRDSALPGTGPTAGSLPSSDPRFGVPSDRYTSGGSTYPSTGSSRWDAGSPASATSPYAGARSGTDPYLPARSRAPGDDRLGGTSSSGSGGSLGSRTGSSDPFYTPESAPPAGSAFAPRGSSAAAERSPYTAPSRDYNPGSTGYTPGSTGYNPPGVDPYRVPSGSYAPPSSYSSPTSNLEDGASYRPGSTDPRRKSEFAAPAADKASTDSGSDARSESGIAPVSYDGPSSAGGSTLRR